MTLGACAIPEPVATVLTPHTGATFEPSKSNRWIGRHLTPTPHPYRSEPSGPDCIPLCKPEPLYPSRSPMGTPLWPSRRVRRHGDDDSPADRLLGVRKRNKATEYLVKWKGINPDTIGALNFDIGRDSNVDCLVVGSDLRGADHHLADEGQAGAVHGDGAVPDGQDQRHLRDVRLPADVARDAQEAEAPRRPDRVRQESVLPDAHPLSRKGWRELPPGACTLPDEIAAPGGPPLQPRRPVKAAPKRGKRKGRKRARISEAQDGA